MTSFVCQLLIDDSSMNDTKKSNRLLIVDDALIMRRRIAEIATASGWLIAAEARDGSEAVAAFRDHRPDLVTLDIVMPNLDGVQALQQIMNIDPEAQVVMVSAVNQKEKLAECIRGGAIDFIVKPFDARRLKAFFVRRLVTDSGS